MKCGIVIDKNSCYGDTTSTYNNSNSSSIIKVGSGCYDTAAASAISNLPTTNVTGIPYCPAAYSSYSENGPYIYSSTRDNTGVAFNDNTNGFWENVDNSTVNGRLNRIGLWTCSGMSSTDFTPFNQWTGFTMQVYFPQSGTYYFGMAGDNYVRVSLDGTRNKGN